MSENWRGEAYQPKVSPENVREDVMDLKAQLTSRSHDDCEGSVTPV